MGISDKERAYQAKYRGSPKGKAAAAAYAARPDVKAKHAKRAAERSRTARTDPARLEDMRRYWRERSRKYRTPERAEKERIRKLWRKYGLTDADVERMFAAQAGLCAVCMDEISLILGSQNYRQIDHNHLTGQNRELLCMGCNTAIGMLKESPERARLAANYLEAHK